MPVGPNILWPLKAMKSTPSSCTLTGACGTAWAPSTRTSAPALWARAASSFTGLTVPRTLEAAVKAKSRVRGVSSRGTSSITSVPSSATRTKSSSTPFSAARICQGTRFAWCSISVSKMRSPRCRLARPQL